MSKNVDIVVTVKALIKLLISEQSDLGLHCLLKLVCPNTLNFIGRCQTRTAYVEPSNC